MSIARSVRVAALAAFALTGVAQAAAPVTFNLTSQDTSGASAAFTVSGLTLTVTAAGSTIQVRDTGLGVNGSGMNTSLNNGESLLLSFSQIVTLTGVGLIDTADSGTNAGANTGLNTFSLAVDSGTPTNIGFGSGTISGLSYTGTTFKITSADSLQLRGLTVSAVPEADAALLALAGLGIVGLRTLRRRTSI